MTYFTDEDYLAKKMLPIALDCGGNMFLLNVSNSSENGEVYIEIHDEFDENDECCIVKIADSFTDFVSLIIWDK